MSAGFSTIIIYSLLCLKILSILYKKAPFWFFFEGNISTYKFADSESKLMESLKDASNHEN